MKRIAVILLLAGAFGCSKSVQNANTTPTQRGALTASDATVAQNQPLTVTAPASAASADTIVWSVSPAAYAVITSNKTQATVTFSKSGSYVVTATYSLGSDNVVDSVGVTCNDSVYTPPPAPVYDTVAFSGDQLNITPTVDDTTYELDLQVKSSKMYACFPTMIYSDTSSWAGGLSFTFYSVVQGSTAACGTTNPATAYFALNNPQAPADGTYPLAITFEGQTYTGSITVSDQYYTFNWTYTSGVVISPLQVAK
jgi:hypothetical protein